MMENTEIVFAALGVVGSGGVMWGVTKATISNLRHSLAKHIESDEKHQTETRVTQLENVQRLVRLETLVTEIHKSVVKE